MRAHRAATLVIIMALAAPAAAQPSAWYDEADLVATLRPADRRTIAAQVGDASDLPLYELTLELSDDLRSFELDETVWFTNRAGRPLADVVFRIFANAVGDPPVRVEAIECLDGISCTSERVSPSAFVVRPSRPIAPDGRLRVRMRLRGDLREIAPERTTMMGQSLESLGALTGGHGGGDYGLLAHSDGVASMAFFFPVLARMRGGRWEQSDASTAGDLGNDELAHVRARVRTPPGVRVAASGVVSAPQSRGGQSEHVVRAGFIRDFALVASRRLSHRQRRVNGVVVRSYFIDGHARSGARVLGAATHALRIFSRRFGPYPYTELDVAEAPLIGGAGGVEFSGFMTVATMFYRPLSAGQGGLLGQLVGRGGQDLEARRHAMLEFVTAHEVAHQWWHGVVGSDSRRHPYQDECLAQYSALLYVEERYGPERARREAEQQVAAGYHMMRLLGRPDAAVDRPVSAFADSLTYAGLVYGKGPFLYPALRALLGDRAFFAALRGYVREHRFRVAPPRAIFDRMARGRHADRVRALVRHWLDEAHGDADLGQPDLGSMLGVGGGANDPTMQMLQQLLGQLNGQGGSDALMRRLMEMLQQSGGAP